MSLMRNLDITPCNSKGSNSPAQTEILEEQDGVDRNIEVRSDLGFKDSECCSPRLFAELSPEALNYIQKLQSELTIAKEVTLVFLFGSQFQRNNSECLNLSGEMPEFI